MRSLSSKEKWYKKVKPGSRIRIAEGDDGDKVRRRMRDEVGDVSNYLVFIGLESGDEGDDTCVYVGTTSGVRLGGFLWWRFTAHFSRVEPVRRDTNIYQSETKGKKDERPSRT